MTYGAVRLGFSGMGKHGGSFIGDFEYDAGSLAPLALCFSLPCRQPMANGGGHASIPSRPAPPM